MLSPALVVFGVCMPTVIWGISLGAFVAGDQKTDTIKIFGFMVPFAFLWMWIGLIYTLFQI